MSLATGGKSPTMVTQASVYTFEWKIEGFTKLQNREHKSEEFYTSERHLWQLAIYPFGTDFENKPDNVDFALVHRPIGKSPLIFYPRRKVEYRMFFRIGGREVWSTRNIDDFTVLGQFPVWSEPIRGKFISIPEVDENFVFGVEIQVPKLLKSKTSRQPLADALATLLNNRQCADVIFRIQPEKRKIYANKSVLVARSQYFTALFNSGMQEIIEIEEHKLVVIVTDFTYNVFYAMLQYLYTDSLDFNCTEVTVGELYEISDKYNIEELRNAMEECIIESLTAETVVKILFGFGHRYSLLRKVCLDYIYGNFKRVSNAGGIQGLEWRDDNFQCYSELMNEIVNNVSEQL